MPCIRVAIGCPFRFVDVDVLKDWTWIGDDELRCLCVVWRLHV